jgi:protein-disulfide isomerase
MNRAGLAITFLALGIVLGFYLGGHLGGDKVVLEPRGISGGRQKVLPPGNDREPAPGASLGDSKWLENAFAGAAPSRGGEQARITIVEFSDFNCRYCAGMAGVLDRVWDSYGDKVRIIFKHNPFPGHPLSLEAHKASVAAFQQGRFWEMQTLLFANQETLDSRSLRGHAKILGLNMEQFEDDFESAEVEGIVERDIAQAKAADVSRVPTLFLNGMKLQGGFTYELLVDRIEKELGRTE